MKRALTLLVPFALVLAACGGDDNGPLDDAAGDDAVPEQSGDDSDTSNGSDTGTGDSDGAATGDAPTGDSGSEYCSLARSFQEGDAALDVFGDMSGSFEPDSIRDGFDVAADALDQIRQVAPDELQGAYQDVAEGFDELRSELEEVDYDFFALDPAELEDLGEGMDDASMRIEEYDREVCGIEGADPFGDDAPGAADDQGSADMPGGDDMPFDPEELGIDMEDMGEFGEIMQEQAVQGFLAEGYSQGEAECLAEAIFSMEFSFDPEDPEALENFEDPFESCGVEP
ncbi:MAG: hypothetical protein WD225_09565 [Ilumatobacteraceae bacterium]